jgi:scavenger receptor class B, member 1
VTAYKHFVFATDPTVELLELGKRQLRRGSSLLITGQHRIMAHRDSYHLLRPAKPPSVHRNSHSHSATKPINTSTSSDSNEDE